MTDPSGRIALVTGASRGIGAAVAEALAQSGAHVIALARTQGALEALDDRIRAKGGAVTLMPMDLRRLEEVDKLGPAIFERFGRLDILIGNAGMLGPLSPVHQIEPKEWERVMNVNFMANVRLVRTLDPLLRASDAGRVVFTVTHLTQHISAYWAPYASSKAALELFAKTYAAETVRTKMRINCVRPGAVDTAMLREAFPGGFPGAMKKPEEVAQAFLDLAVPSCKKHGEIISL